jgi:hypothetical protein
MSWSRRTSWAWLMLALCLVGCGQSAHVRGLSKGGDTTRLQPLEGEPVLAGNLPEPAADGGGALERRTEKEAGAARRAEVARALEAVITVASSVERVGAKQVWSYWVEGGALTPVGFRSEPGRGPPARGIKDPQKLDQRMQTALGEHTPVPGVARVVSAGSGVTAGAGWGSGPEDAGEGDTLVACKQREQMHHETAWS